MATGLYYLSSTPREVVAHSIQDGEKDPLLSNGKAQFEETAVETEGRLY